MLNFKSKRYFGIDIGESAIKLVEVKKTRDGYHLARGYLIELDIDPSFDDSGKRSSIIKDKLKKLLAEEHIDSGTVALSIPSQSAFIRFLKIPKIAKSKIEQIIQYEAQLQVPFPINEVIWSYGVFEAYDSPETDVILVAVKKDIVEEKLKLLADTPLETDFVEVSYFSIFNALDFVGEIKDKLILDIGAKNTNIIMVEEHKIWTRSILTGGNDLTKAIAAHLKISFKEAEQIKRKEGIIAMNSEERTLSPHAADISDAINPVLIEMLADISKSIGYYKSQFGGTKVIKDVLLTGGASKIRNMDRFIHENLDIPTKPANIFDKMKSDIDFHLTENLTRRMDAAIGLALKTVTPLYTKTNLLPKEILKSKEFEKKRWHIFGSLIVVICIFATLANFMMWGSHDKARSIMKASALIDRYTSFNEEIESLQSEVGDLKARLEFIEKVSAKRGEAIRVTAEMMKILPDNLWLTEITRDGDSITVNGKTEGTFENINTFKDMLIKSGYFTEVKVESANVLKDKESTEDIRAFTIKMKITPPLRVEEAKVILKRNLFSAIIIGLLAAALVFAIGLFVFFMLKDTKIGKEIMTKSGTIDGFVKKSKMPLTENSVSFLEDERNKLKSAYSRLKLALMSPLGEEVPLEGMDSLQFKEKLVQTQKKLREEAKDFSLVLPDSLGFTKYETELSDSAEIPYLSKRLKVLEELIYLMTLTGVASLDEISFIGEGIKKEKASAIYEEIAVSFKITCTYSKLMDFLYRLKVSPFIFVADDLDINKTKDVFDRDQAAESMLQAVFLVKAELIN